MIKRSLFLLSGLIILIGQAYPQLEIGNTQVDTLTIAGGYDTPWEILWGPDHKIWITERSGRVSTLDPVTGGKTELLVINEVHEQSESGLLGMAIDPGFSENSHVYLVYNYLDGGKIKEKLVRYTYTGSGLEDPFELMSGIGGAGNHNGSRLAFGPDGKLYMTTGDAVNTSTSQDKSSLNGKILRINPDGTVPSDNPFGGSYVWSLGHRNPQGLVFSPTGKLFSSEHGPANDDELNLIVKAGNFGWPDVHGFCDQPTETSFCQDKDVVEPLAAWTPTLAVAGIDYYGSSLIPEWDNSILMVSLKSGRLTALKLNSDTTSVSGQTHLFQGSIGRLRDVCVDPDGRIYISTSNLDGRGTARKGDDRIIRLSPPETTSTQVSLFDNTRVYPNPLHGDALQIKGLPEGDNQISIIDVNGRILLSRTFAGPDFNLTVQAGPGMYLIRMANSGSIKTRIIVKEY